MIRTKTDNSKRLRISMLYHGENRLAPSSNSMGRLSKLEKDAGMVSQPHARQQSLYRRPKLDYYTWAKAIDHCFPNLLTLQGEGSPLCSLPQTVPPGKEAAEDTTLKQTGREK